MNASFRHLGWLSLATFALVGCDAPVAPPAPSAPTPPPAATTPGEKNDIKAMPVEPAKPDTKGASAAKLSDEEVAEIKKLPAAEQTVALAQMVCPVSGKNLGSMDMPLKQTVNGKDFYLCCSGCEDDVKKDPAAVLAKLQK